tara:strand:+ start:302 stop:427 length:126 start_codon:yes stop_codon:yes gene_type:complete
MAFLYLEGGAGEKALPAMKQHEKELEAASNDKSLCRNAASH